MSSLFFPIHSRIEPQRSPACSSSAISERTAKYFPKWFRSKLPPFRSSINSLDFPSELIIGQSNKSNPTNLVMLGKRKDLLQSIMVTNRKTAGLGFTKSLKTFCSLQLHLIDCFQWICEFKPVCNNCLCVDQRTICVLKFNYCCGQFLYLKKSCSCLLCK